MQFYIIYRIQLNLLINIRNNEIPHKKSLFILLLYYISLYVTYRSFENLYTPLSKKCKFRRASKTLSFLKTDFNKRKHLLVAYYYYSYAPYGR
jgi:hypothetical protein